MTLAFADTHYYLALLNPRDEWHAAALRLSEDESLRVVTSEFVLMEVADGLADTTSRRLVGTLVAALRADRRTQVVRATGPLFNDALALYLRRPDKHWSLTDCTSFVIMNRRRIRRALTADRHFVQAGFGAMLL